ncbi:MAG: CocE/NonD family hydrolase [Chlorobi bacterium]|nr:CocE/NonD family hydrolase [Chlorobiota bacterium]
MKHVKLTLVLLFQLFIVAAFSGNEIYASEKGKILADQSVIMKDGTALATDIYIPAGEGPFPCILIRTPYNKKGTKGDCEWFQEKGFVVVTQDCRGKYGSQGKFYPWIHDRADGLETLEWIRGQEWFSGKIGTWGGSYVGYTQWAISDQVDVITPYVTGADMYDLFYPAGIFSLGLSFSWGFIVDAQETNSIPPEKSKASYSILPLSAAAEETIGKRSEFMDDWLKHENRDEYWQSQNHRGIAKADVISIAGWYDIFLLDQLADFEALNSNRNDDRLIVTYFRHGSPAMKNDYGGPTKTGEPGLLAKQYLMNHLQDEQSEIFVPPFKDTKYNLFIMERNEFYGADNWPPKAASFVNYYFGPNEYISTTILNDNTSLTYSYDPADPYPNLGGTAIGKNVGPALQNSNVDRKDQVVFESSELDSSLVLLGPISATLYVSSDVKSTDFYVCLQDVFENGDIVNIQEGGAKVNFDKDEIEQIDVDVWATGYQLNAGHKLRVVVCSSWFPRYNRNLNTGKPIFSATEIKVARQEVHFGPEYPSHITLPVLDLK